MMFANGGCQKRKLLCMLKLKENKNKDLFTDKQILKESKTQLEPSREHLY